MFARNTYQHEFNGNKSAGTPSFILAALLTKTQRQATNTRMLEEEREKEKVKRKGKGKELT